MKVVTNTPSQLILEHNPIVLAICVNLFDLIFIGVGLFLIGSQFIIGLVFLLTGISFALIFNLVFIRRTQLILERPTNNVELRLKSLLGYKRRSWELEYLSRAETQTSVSGNTNTQRAALVFEGGMAPGTVPVTTVYSSGGGAERATQAINTWLGSARGGD